MMLQTRRLLAGLVLISLLPGCREAGDSPGGAAEGVSRPAESMVAAGPPEGSVVEEADIPADILGDSWARLPRLAREQLEADGRRAWDVIVHPESRYAGGPGGPVAMWMYSPRIAEHIFPASTYLRFETDKDQRLTELAILATARELKSQFEWTSHEPLARRAGLEDAIVDIVKYRKVIEGIGDVPGLGEQERTIIRFVREVVSEPKLSSDTYARAIELFGEGGVMDLAGLVGYYMFVDVTLKTFDVHLAPGRVRLLPPLW